MMYNLQISVSEMAKSTVEHCQMMYNWQISVFGGSEMAKSPVYAQKQLMDHGYFEKKKICL